MVSAFGHSFVGRFLSLGFGLAWAVFNFGFGVVGRAVFAFWMGLSR